MSPFWSDAAVTRWVRARLPDAPEFGAARAMGVADRCGALVAGVVFHGWNPARGVIEMSCAADDPRWLTRTVARAAFGYAFDVARVAYATCSERNAPVRRIWRACGAHEAIIPAFWGEDEAAALLTLTAADWRASKLGRD